VTSQNAQIQALIHEIDQVINRPSPQLPWRIASGEVEQQRRILEKTRDYLIFLDQQIDQQVAAEVETLVAARVAELGYVNSPPQAALMPAPAETAQQVLQAVLQEMSYLRSNVMQSLRNDVEGLQQRREALAQEIRLLETQRQQYLSPIQVANQQQIVNQFLQSLMAQLQENLTGQVAQMLSNLAAQTLTEGQMRTIETGRGRSLSHHSESNSDEVAVTYATALSPAQRLEHLKMMQIQSDQLLLKLDATLRVIFESLQNNLQTYQDSLSQGLDRMYSMGQQGEVMFSAFVSRLAQEMGQEASTYLHASVLPTLASEHEAGSPDENEAQPFELPSLFDESDELTTVLQLDEPEPSGPELSDPEITEPPDLALFDLDLSQVSLDSDTSTPLLLEDEIDRLLQTDSLANPQLSSALDLLSPSDEEMPSRPAEELQAEELEPRSELELTTAHDTSGPQTTIQELNEEEPNPDRNLDELYESLFGATAIQPPLQEQPASNPDLDPSLFEDQRFEDQRQATEASWLDPVAMADDRADEQAESRLEDMEGTLILGDFLLDAPPSEAPASAETPASTILANTPDPFILEESSESQLNTVPQLDSESTLTEPVTGEVTEQEAIEQEAIDVITRLTDLLPAFAPTLEPEPVADVVDIDELSNATEQSSLSIPPPVTGSAEDGYVPASLEETLLVSNREEAEKRLDVRLSANTLQQLAADLSSLEGLDTELVSFTPPLEAIDDWTPAAKTGSAAVPTELEPVPDLSLGDGQLTAIESGIESDWVEARSVPLEMEPESNLDTTLFLDPTASLNTQPASELQSPAERISPVEDDETATLLLNDPDVVPSHVTPPEQEPIATPAPASENLFESNDSISIETLFDTPAAISSPSVGAVTDSTAPTDWSSLTTLEDLFAATELDQLFLDDSGSEPNESEALMPSSSDPATLAQPSLESVEFSPVDASVVTLADLFGSDPSTDLATVDVTELPPSDPFQTESSGEELNAFTLEGLDSLFEEVPTGEPFSVPIQPPVDDRSTDLNPDLFLTKEQVVQGLAEQPSSPDRPIDAPKATQKKSP